MASAAWLKDPSAVNDPTAEAGWRVQRERRDLVEGNALVQTPAFVVDFILDRTLTPAIATFGLPHTTVIDPACGTGHFLCAAFMRLAAGWSDLVPEEELGERGRMCLAQMALDQVAGVDIDPDCVDLARQRLSALASEYADTTDDAYPWRTHVACADSLLHGPDSDGGLPGDEHRCDDRDCEQAQVILGCTYAAVVGNPPYIPGHRMGTAKDKAYRARYRTCCRQYSLSVPFMELFFALAHRGTEATPVGQQSLFDGAA